LSIAWCLVFGRHQARRAPRHPQVAPGSARPLVGPMRPSGFFTTCGVPTPRCFVFRTPPGSPGHLCARLLRCLWKPFGTFVRSHKVAPVPEGSRIVAFSPAGVKEKSTRNFNNPRRSRKSPKLGGVSDLIARWSSPHILQFCR